MVCFPSQFCDIKNFKNCLQKKEKVVKFKPKKFQKIANFFNEKVKKKFPKNKSPTRIIE